MVSFDVKSLFTNIPLNESIQIILDQCFINSVLYHGFPRKEFEDLLNLALTNCHFLFYGNFYDQIDGVAMGSIHWFHFWLTYFSHVMKRYMVR